MFLLMLIENCGGFAGSHLQFGGVHVKISYTFRHVEGRFCGSAPSRAEPCVELEVARVLDSLTGCVEFIPPFGSSSMSVIGQFYPVRTKRWQHEARNKRTKRAWHETPEDAMQAKIAISSCTGPVARGVWCRCEHVFISVRAANHRNLGGDDVAWLNEEVPDKESFWQVLLVYKRTHFVKIQLAS
jgi:hypothetical protein